MPFDALPNPDAITENPIVQILLDGYARVEDKKHWCRDRFATRTGRFCAAGSIAPHCIGIPPNLEYIGRFEYRLNPAERLALSFLNQAALSRGFASITNANDDRMTTHARMLEIYRDAIERAQNAEALK